jgi:stearoyl-CoA desaturase (delta-9 desaturase)
VQVLRNEQRLGSRVINRAAEQLASQFSSERIALAVKLALQGPQLSALQQALIHARHRTTEVLETLHLPHIPGREELVAAATAMFARTKALDEIVDRAYKILLVSVGARLSEA